MTRNIIGDEFKAKETVARKVIYQQASVYINRPFSTSPITENITIQTGLIL